jgi:hypothetical protein
VNYRLLSGTQIPVWHIAEGHAPSFADEPIRKLYQQKSIVNGTGAVAFRGVPITRLGAVLDHGVDVRPTDGTIFCSDEDKAYEYARPQSLGGPGMIYALHEGYLERSFRTLPADASAEEIADIKATYPHCYEISDGRLYFSRLPDQNNIAYEMAYGYWIPGRGKDALLAIFLTGPLEEVSKALKDAQSQ